MLFLWAALFAFADFQMTNGKSLYFVPIDRRHYVIFNSCVVWHIGDLVILMYTFAGTPQYFNRKKNINSRLRILLKIILANFVLLNCEINNNSFTEDFIVEPTHVCLASVMCYFTKSEVQKR